MDSTTKNATVVILAFFALAAFASGLLAAVDWNLFLAMKIITGFFVAVNLLIYIAVIAKRIWNRRQTKLFKKKCEERNRELELLFEVRRNAQERIDAHRREVLGISDEEWEKQKEARRRQEMIDHGWVEESPGFWVGPKRTRGGS